MKNMDLAVFYVTICLRKVSYLTEIYSIISLLYVVIINNTQIRIEFMINCSINVQMFLSEAMLRILTRFQKPSLHASDVMMPDFSSCTIFFSISSNLRYHRIDSSSLNNIKILTIRNESTYQIGLVKLLKANKHFLFVILIANGLGCRLQ